VETGVVTIAHPETVVGPPPQVEHKSRSFLYLMAGILIGTLFVLLLIKLNVKGIWKYWFLLSVWITIAVTLGVYINFWAAGFLAILLALWKVYKPNVYIHNFTEIFIYTGIAVIFLPIMNLFASVVLLILISIYDMFAVWKSKHMITLAKFQTKSKIFAGLLIPYGKKEKKPKAKIKGKVKKVLVKTKTAILGGGDIAFPLLFNATVMEFLILDQGFAKPMALLLTGIVALTASAALLLLFLKAKKGRFYPAMPFISIGCFVGLGIVWLVGLF
jgi:presenilin-like A22 family membrane protease